jgi:hypothetical protein
MDGNQAIEMIDSWNRILIAGKPEQISAMLADVEARFEKKGFARDPATEKTMTWHPRQRNTVFCFVGGPQSGPRLMLCLNRVSERRVRGGTYSIFGGFAGPGPLEVAAVIHDVIENVVIPSANHFGLKVAKPRFGPNSSVPPRTMAALVAFSDVAAGELPLSTTAETAWRKFLIAAGQEDVIIDADELMGWFNANGWSIEASRHLNDRFFSESTLLSEFAEAIRS